MEKIIFGGKQFYLGTLRMTRSWLTRFGLTPARFTMLCAITSNGYRGVAQHDLLKLLGVSSATICRMLKSLEDLGLVVRTPHPKNPRRRWVKITASAAWRLRDAIEDVVESGELAFAVAEILRDPSGDPDATERAIEQMDNLLTRGRRALNDIATLVFPYEGHDLGGGCGPYARPYAA